MIRQKFLQLLSLNQTTGREYTPRQPEHFSIPKIIHQTYRSWDALPQNIKDSIEELRARNVGWEYRFYDDADVVQFIRDAYGSAVLTRFNRIDPRYGAARADLFRYLLAYRVGGVYLDIKSTAHRPLDEVLHSNDRLVLTQWPQNGRFSGAGIHDWDLADKIQGGEFQQWHIICAPGHPYMHAVIQAVMRNIDCYIPHMHGSGRNAVLRLTGPIAYTLAMLPLTSSNLHRLVAAHDDLGLDYSVYRENSDHKTLFATHYADLTCPIVRATSFRRLLSKIYRIYDALRR